MPILVNMSDLQGLAPLLHPAYRAAFEAGQPMLDACGISASPLRMAHFMAQVLHESGGLTVLVENLHYSAARLPQVWPTRFRPGGPLDPNEYAGDERKLAAVVYGGRMGNREPEDGFRFRGRGLLQLTGKDNYLQATLLLQALDGRNPDFAAAPDAVIDPAWCVGVAAAWWAAHGANALADADDLLQLTRLLNGAALGLLQRQRWLDATRALWCGDGAL